MEDTVKYVNVLEKQFLCNPHVERRRPKFQSFIVFYAFCEARFLFLNGLPIKYTHDVKEVDIRKIKTYSIT